MRTSDWSSDVCSSDLHAIAALRDCTRALQRAAHVRFAPDRHSAADVAFDHSCIFAEQHGSASLAGQRFAQFDERLPLALEIGRASCRERVCQYVSISVVAVLLKKKTTQNH